jgi:hypothetical protein
VADHQAQIKAIETPLREFLDQELQSAACSGHHQDTRGFPIEPVHRKELVMGTAQTLPK